MSTNGVSVEDADMAECDGEKVVTMMDVLQEQQEFEEDANAVLGASDDKNCTYNKGYIKRQAIYACLTCCYDAKEDPTKRAGVCLACSLTCHENHDLVELYTKRNFRCDCGNPKFNNPCQYTQSKTELNDDNSYNQNFSGLYCTCHRPYPDPDGIEEEMIQCIVCEDWLHASHLEATVPSSEVYAEMICKACMDKNSFLHDYSKYAVNGDVDVVTNESEISAVCNGDSNVIGNNEETGSDEDKKVASEVNGELKDIIHFKAVSEIEEKSENSINPTEATNNACLENDDIKSDEQTESTNPVLENTDDKLSENEDKPKDLTEDSVPADIALNEEQNSTNVQEDLKGVSDISIESKNEITTDITENDAQVNSKNVKDNNEINHKQDESSTNIPQQSPNGSDINAVGDTEESITNMDEVGTKADEMATDKENSTQNLDDQQVGSDEKQIDFADSTKIDEMKTDNENSKTVPDDQQVGSPKIEINSAESTKTDEMETDKENSDTKPDDQQDGSQEEQIDSVESTKTDVMETDKGNSDTTPDDQQVGSQEKQIDSAESAKTDEMETDQDNSDTKRDDQQIDSQEKLIYSTDSIKTDEIKTDTENTNTKPDDRHVSSQEKQTDSTELNENSFTDKQDIEINKSIEDNTPTTEAQSKEHKRKLLTEETVGDINVKKPKLEGTKCLRPRSTKVFKGATFWPSHFRQKLCTCSECIAMYKDLSVLFLIDPEDTVTAYEALGKERTDGTASTQYEQGLEALSSLGRIQQINALTEYNKMRDKLLDFLKSFKDRREVVKEEDIKAFFAGMKPKREPDGVYFCR